MRKPGSSVKRLSPRVSPPIGLRANRACISAGILNFGAESSTSRRLIFVYVLVRVLIRERCPLVAFWNLVSARSCDRAKPDVDPARAVADGPLVPADDATDRAAGERV